MSLDTDPDHVARALAAEVTRSGERVGAARILLLDLDGTLAPLAPTPEEARVPPPTLAALRALVERGWLVAVVSGRILDQVRRMVPVCGVLHFGSHGLEGSLDGSHTAPDVDPDRVSLLDGIEREALKTARDFPGARIERKPAGIAFHDRLLGEDMLPEWRRALGALLKASVPAGMEMMEGKRLLELRPLGNGKGDIVRILADHRSVSVQDSSFLAMGDDRTDEDMFLAINGFGLSVKVGREGEETVARRRLENPHAVRIFLETLSLPLPNRSGTP